MNKVYILSKRQFDNLMRVKGLNDENVEQRVKTAALISINSENELDETDRNWFKEDHSNVLTLFFDDVERDVEWEQDGKKHSAKAFTKEQAYKVFDFIKANHDKETFIVHCHAGISRSGAIGTFISEYFKMDADEFKRDNPYIHPNGITLRTLRNIFHGYET